MLSLLYGPTLTFVHDYWKNHSFDYPSLHSLYQPAHLSVQFSHSFVPTLYDPMNRSTPDLTVHHQLQSPLKLMSIESVIPSSYLILCRPLLLQPLILPSIRVFSNESTLRMRWPKYWSFSLSISPSNEHLGLVSLSLVQIFVTPWTVVHQDPLSMEFTRQEYWSG